MAIREIVIKNKVYKVACNDGQEDRLSFLGKRIKARVDKIAKITSGNASDATLLLLAALEVEDALYNILSQNETPESNSLDREKILKKINDIIDDIKSIQN